MKSASRLIALLLFIISCIGCREQTSLPNDFEPIITIGVIAPVEGPLWLYGRECIKGLNLKMDECSAMGGVKGRKIVLRIENNAGDPLRSADAVKRLATDSTVLAIIGPVTSNNFMAAAAVAQHEKIPILSPYSTNSSVTEIGDYVSRICFTDIAQGRVMAGYAYHSLGLRKVAILSEKNNSYSDALGGFFDREFTKLGGVVCAKSMYTTQDNQYLPLLGSIFLKSPDAIFMPGYFPQARQLLNDLVTIGRTTTCLGGDGWESLEQMELPADVINDRFPIYITGHFSPEEMQLSAQHFVQLYESRYNQSPNSLSALAYDAAGIIVEALQRSSRLDRAALKDAIVSTSEYAGATGNITLNEKRDAVKPVYVQEFRSGKFHLRAFNVSLP